VLKFWKMHTGDYHSGFSKLLGHGLFRAGPDRAPDDRLGVRTDRVAATYFGPVMSIYCLLMAVLSGTALFILSQYGGGRVTCNASSANMPAVVYDEFHV